MSAICEPAQVKEGVTDLVRASAVLAHVEHPLGHPWVEIDELVTATLAEIVGKTTFLQFQTKTCANVGVQQERTDPKSRAWAP